MNFPLELIAMECFQDLSTWQMAVQKIACESQANREYVEYVVRSC